MLANKGLVARPAPASATATPVPSVRPFQVLFPPAPAKASSKTVVARHSNTATEVSTSAGATAVLDEAILQDELAASTACGTDGARELLAHCLRLQQGLGITGVWEQIAPQPYRLYINDTRCSILAKFRWTCKCRHHPHAPKA
eukprot:scaffold193884_cov22-Tisochrysis_lutea.AAC.1